MNARFLVYGQKGVVKLTLSPGQKLSHHWSNWDCEGYTYKCQTWEYQDSVIHKSVATGGRDCDGRIDYYSEYMCAVENLCGYVTDNGASMPMWQETETVVADQYAQMAGY